MMTPILSSGTFAIALKTYLSISSFIISNILFLVLLSHASYQKIFPYTQYYPNQKEIIEFVSKTVRQGKNPVFESPTGSGKTIAVLSALIPLASEKGKKILYLCRTHEQMDRVIEELRMISEDGIDVKGLSLRSRRDMCLNKFIQENTVTTGEDRFACSVLKKEGKCSYYKNMKTRAMEFKRPMTSAEISKTCEAKDLCPYEVSRTLLSDCDVIACSYLYVFDPKIKSIFLKALNMALDDFILVLDEAHNLPRLAADLAGEKLTEFAVSRALKEADDHKVLLSKELLEKLHRFIVLNESNEQRLKRESLLSYLGDDVQKIPYIESVGEDIQKRKLSDGKRPISFLHTCASFMRSWMECSEDVFAFFSSKTSRDMPFLEILSLEPKTITQQPLEEAYITVHMSGTLTPIDPYCDVVGQKNFVTNTFPSPFPKENITTFVDTSVTTLGSLRSPEMYKRMAKQIESYVSVIPGNVLVFFPSYVVLKSVLDAGIRIKKDVFIERPDLTSRGNNDMIQRFKKSKNAILFGVQQGRNSEGQDFPGDQANAVLVVGIPYAVRSPKITAQIDYYKQIHRGWWGRYPLGEYYAYFLPAYRSLNQAAGRAHRQLTDKAAIIFLERRVAFDKKVKVNLVPWIKENLNASQDIEKELKEFY